MFRPIRQTNTGSRCRSFFTASVFITHLRDSSQDDTSNLIIMTMSLSSSYSIFRPFKVQLLHSIVSLFVEHSFYLLKLDSRAGNYQVITKTGQAVIPQGRISANVQELSYFRFFVELHALPVLRNLFCNLCTCTSADLHLYTVYEPDRIRMRDIL